MKITILASGSSGNCYHISDGETELLLDAGIPLKEIRARLDYQTTSLNGVLVTHEHRDHCKAVPDLLKYGGVNIYAPVEVFDSFKLSDRRCIELHPRYKQPIGTFEILPFDCEHDVPNLGYLILSRVTGEQLLYYTDTAYLRYTFPGIHYLMGECNYSLDAINASVENGHIPAELKPRLLKTHMSIDTFCDMLAANGYTSLGGKPRLKQIYLLHLSGNNSNAEDFRQRVAELTACEVYIA